MSDLTNPASFEEKMMTRIKESIGDLMTDEQLKGILEKGVEKAFFERRTERVGYQDRTLPSLVDTAVEKFLDARMKEAVDRYLTENPEAVLAKVQEAIDAGVAGCLLRCLETKLGSAFREMLVMFEMKLKNQ